MRLIDADALEERIGKLKSEICSRAAGWVEEDSYECGAIDGLLDALKYVEEAKKAKPRLLTPEEVRNLTAGTPVVMERLLHDGTGVDPYSTIKVWGLCSVSGKMIISFDGMIFPDTVKKIPYRTICTRRDNGEQECRLYRFWTGTTKPTDEQSEAIPWEEGG